MSFRGSGDGGDGAWRVAVVGGGISGLAAAHRLVKLCRADRRPLGLTLFEAGPRLGGTIETRTIHGYLAESGADSFITNKPWMANLCSELDLEEEIISTQPRHRRSLVLRRGKPEEVPAGFMLLAPVRLGPVLTSPLFTPWGKLRLLLEAVIPARRDEADESLAAFARRRLGREVWERLVQPLVGGIYTADPERLSVLATLPRFREMERRHGSLIRASRRGAPGDYDSAVASGARYSLFATLKGGLSVLVERLRERIEESAVIRLNAPVTSICKAGSNSSWQVDFSDGSAEPFDAVIVALPAHRADAVLRPVDAALADRLGRIEYASSAVIVTGHKLADVGHSLDAFGLVVPHIENRKVLAVSFASRKFPGRAPDGCVQLRTFVGGALQPELLARSDAELAALVRAELGELLGVQGREDFVHITRYDCAMPQYHVGHLDLVRAIEERAAGLKGLELAGNAYHGVGLPDSIHSGESAAERLMAKRSPASEMAASELPGKEPNT